MTVQKMVETKKEGDAREGEAEPSWPWRSVKACLYSVRKNVNMSLFIRALFLQAGKESDVSIFLFC